jgi:hypothetical protein
MSNIGFPNPVSPDVDFTALDVPSYMETSGFNSSVDAAFAELETELTGHFKRLQEYIDSLFDALFEEYSVD